VIHAIGEKMQIDKIDHIGIAVDSLSASLKFWEDSLGLKFHPPEIVEDQGVTVAMGEVGATHIELLEALNDKSPIAGFINKRGQGIHHMALKVDNIEAALVKLKASGARLIDEVPRIGAGGKRIAFVHPKSTSGVLLELCEQA
jgi:methylmalonyl-CoA/ethylmalonyl-CoA epimerase